MSSVFSCIVLVCFEHFLAFYQRNILGPSCDFPALGLELAISPRSMIVYSGQW